MCMENNNIDNLVIINFNKSARFIPQTSVFTVLVSDSLNNYVKVTRLSYNNNKNMHAIKIKSNRTFQYQIPCPRVINNNV